jgi:hypothetical protein
METQISELTILTGRLDYIFPQMLSMR